MGVDGCYCVFMLVECKIGFVIIKKLWVCNKEQVIVVILKVIKEYEGWFKMIMFDNGIEFYDYKFIEQVYLVCCYFVMFYYLWECGSNENMNGLICQYLFKGQCM